MKDRAHALAEIVAIAATGIDHALLILPAASRMDADGHGFQLAMDDFRDERQRLTERRSPVDGALETSRRTAAADRHHAALRPVAHRRV